MPKTRLDKLLVEKGLFSTREQASRAILAGLVRVKGERIDKAGTLVAPDADVSVTGPALPFVSRGGLKLAKALEVFHIPVQDRVVVDVGASTGGFTDCLLQHGARLVYAVDVGYGQLAWTLRQDPRVVVLERTNVRHLSLETLTRGTGPVPSLAAIDASFISLGLVLPAVKKLLTPDGDVLCLVKPQFEAGREKVKKGVVRDPAVHREVLGRVVEQAQSLGWGAVGLHPSPIRGPEGNVEFLLYLQPGVNRIDAPAIARAVQEAPPA